MFDFITYLKVSKTLVSMFDNSSSQTDVVDVVVDDVVVVVWSFQMVGRKERDGLVQWTVTQGNNEEQNWNRSWNKFI